MTASIVPAPVAAPGPAPAPVTPGNPQSELNSMMANPAVLAALQDAGHPQFREFNDKRTALFAAIYPEPAGAEGAAIEPGAADAGPVDYDKLLIAFESGPPAAGTSPDEAIAAGQHNRAEVAKALGELGVTAEETQRLVREVGGMRGMGVTLTPEQAAEHMRGIWGDQADANVATARRALASLNNPALNEWLIETGLGNSPAVVLTLYEAGKRKGI
jgi:hypothetical protein